MHIVLDSNIIRSAGYGSSNLYQFLQRVANLLEYKIHIPQLVVDEVTAQFEEELEKEKTDTDREARKWGMRLDRTLESSLSRIDPTEEANVLRDKLGAYDSVLPYPDLPHRELALRAIHRRKPFDINGSGYRDSLIWESVLTFAATAKGPVVLLTDDKDFRDDQANLAGDLKADLVELGLEETKVALFRSIPKFIDSYIQPELKEILEAEPTDALAKFFDTDPDEGLALWVQDEWSGRGWTGEELGLPWEYETLILSLVEDVSQLKWLKANEISDDEYLLRVSVKLDCEFDAFVPKAFSYGLEGFSIEDSDWNSYYAQGSTTCALPCELQLHVKFTEDQDPDISLLAVEPTSHQYRDAR